MKKLERRLVFAMLSMCGIVLLTSCGTGKTASEESGESSVKTVQQQAGESDATQTMRPAEPTPTPEPVQTLDEITPLEGLYSELEFNLDIPLYEDPVINACDMDVMQNTVLEIDGKTLNLPCTVKDLEEFGAYFGTENSFMSSDEYALAMDGEIGYEDGMIVPRSYDHAHMFYNMSDGRYASIDIIFKNNTNDHAKMGDLPVEYLRVTTSDIYYRLENLSNITLDDLQFDIAINNVKMGTDYKDIIPTLESQGFDGEKVNYGKIDCIFLDTSGQISARQAYTEFKTDGEEDPYIIIDYSYYDGIIYGLTYHHTYLYND